jgi:hypothetical protein
METAMIEPRSPVRSSSDLEGRDPVDRKHRVHLRPWWELTILGKLSRRKAEAIDRIIDSSDDAPRLFHRMVNEIGVAPKLARKWIRAALIERGRHKEKAKDSDDAHSLQN